MEHPLPIIEQPARRSFLTTTGLVAGTVLCSGVISSILQSCETFESLVVPESTTTDVVFDLTGAPALNTIGAGILVTLKDAKGNNVNNGDEVLIVRKGAASFGAYTAVCTNDGVIVNAPTSGATAIVCKGCSSEYAVNDGSVKKGPATIALESFPTNYNSTANTLTISFSNALRSTTFDTSAEPSLGTIGSGVVTLIPSVNSGNELVIIRKDATSFVVYSAVCTHASCLVTPPSAGATTFRCDCHSSVYSIADGTVKEGPAPSALRAFASQYDNTTKKLIIFY